MSFLNDTQLKQALRDGVLFRRDTWDERQVQQCTYILRMGWAVQRPRHPKGDGAHRIMIDSTIPPGSRETIQPGQTVLLSTIEQFKLADDIFALTVPRGFFYTESLVLASSYADPGFDQTFWIPVINTSDRPIELKPGTSLVRVFVYKLAQPVENSFRREDKPDIAQEVRTFEDREAPSLDQIQTMSADELEKSLRDTPFGNLIVQAIQNGDSNLAANILEVSARNTQLTKTSAKLAADMNELRPTTQLPAEPTYFQLREYLKDFGGEVGPAIVKAIHMANRRSLYGAFIIGLVCILLALLVVILRPLMSRYLPDVATNAVGGVVGAGILGAIIWLWRRIGRSD